MTNLCIYCDAPFPTARADLGYQSCLQCGEAVARQHKHTVIPLHKQGYMAFTGRDALDVVKQINPKRYEW